MMKEPYCGQGDIFDKVPKLIHERDGMLNREKDQKASHYFWVGSSALSAIRTCLEAVELEESSVTRILDYACGYGRVLRWVKAQFPSAYILGVDADPKAAEAAKLVTGVDTLTLDTELSRPISTEKFDMIWVGSLFTHLPEQESEKVLRYLASHLRGVLVFTAYAPRNNRELRDRLVPLGLTDEDSEHLLKEYKLTGYAYGDYPSRDGYGLSFVSACKFAILLERVGLRLVYFRERYWAKRQDVYACILSSDAAAPPI